MKASALFWQGVKHFSIHENWGDPFQIETSLITKLDALREHVGRPIVIHNAFETAGHRPGSAHERGQAADLHIVGMSLIDQWIAAERFSWGGIGLYPYWNDPGLHLDVWDRHDNDSSIDPTHSEARWMRDEHGSYHGLNLATVEEIVEVDRSRTRTITREV